MNHIRILLTLILCVTFIACGSPINENNFNRIETGMAEMEVLNILGDPTDTSNITIGKMSSTTSIWEDENGKITIQFVNGEVQLKMFN